MFNAITNLITRTIPHFISAVSSDALQSGTVWQFIGNFFRNMAETVWGLIVSLVVVVGRFMLRIIDFLFTIMQAFLGDNFNTSGSSSLTDDKIFQFVFSDTVINIIKNIIIIGLILIVVFSIIAIVKSEINGALGDNNSKKYVLVNALKSLFLMVIIPLLFIFSIVLSDAALASLYRATTGGKDVSLAGMIWTASTYEANAYRNYAKNDARIPITFDFSNKYNYVYNEETNEYEIDYSSEINWDEISIEGLNKDLINSFESFKNQTGFQKGYSVWLMFYANNFYSISELDAQNKLLKKNPQGNIDYLPYYDLFDSNLVYSNNEYLVMADLIDFCTVNARDIGTLSFRSINEVYENWASIYGGTITSLPISKVGDNYYTAVTYLGDETPTEYLSPVDTFDESDGTIYTICYSQLVEDPDGTLHEIYIPFINGVNGFSTSYISGKCLVIAKGFFTDKGYPTAIKNDVNGNVVFYRNEVYAPGIYDFFPKITYELPEGVEETWITRAFKELGGQVLGGIDLDDYIPYIYVNAEQVSTYTKKISTETTLENGTFTVSYDQTDIVSQLFNKSSVKDHNIYNKASINIFILIFASLILIRVLIDVVFGLIGRIFHMVVLALTYPGVVSALPLDNGSALSNWRTTFFDVLLSVFGIMVSANVMIALLPYVWEFKFFTDGAIAGSSVIDKVGAGFVNMLLKIAFTVGAIALIETFARLMSFLMNGMSVADAKKAIASIKTKLDDKETPEDPFVILESIKTDGKKPYIDAIIGTSSVLSIGGDLKDEMFENLKFTGDVISGRHLQKTLKNAVGMLADYTGVSFAKNTINEIRSGAHYLQGALGHKSHMHQLTKDLRSGKLTDPKDISKRFKTFGGKGGEHEKDLKNMQWKPPKKNK